MLVILFTDSDNRFSGSRSLRDRLIHLLKHWDRVKQMNGIVGEKQMYDYITNIMLKDLKS